MNNIDRKTLDQAREWAEHAKTLDEISVWPTALAAAEVIQSLPDEIIDGDKVREIIETYEHARDGNAKGSEGWMINHLMVSNLESLLTPPPRTLADMTAEEREACQWMQAEVAGGPFARGVIVDINESCEWVHVVSNSGESHRGSLGFITPLPDLPRMEWPGNEPEEAHVDSPEPAVPRPEDVSETAEQDDEPVLYSDYIYTDRDGDGWEYIEGRWITGDTHAERVAAREYRRGLASLPVRYGPYTRIEKEEDNE